MVIDINIVNTQIEFVFILLHILLTLAHNMIINEIIVKVIVNCCKIKCSLTIYIYQRCGIVAKQNFLLNHYSYNEIKVYIYMYIMVKHFELYTEGNIYLICKCWKTTTHPLPMTMNFYNFFEVQIIMYVHNIIYCLGVFLC